ncbi:MAG TPA: adenylyl-sulfate kinase [Planctomycetota bacterium]|nr:adenylyl-sulfate kinase [Planctomycetota bacterium]
MSGSSRNIHRHDGAAARRDRELLLGQRGAVVWFTGLSGSGKSTVARALEARLLGEGRFAYVLDGDNLRHGLCADLGFSAAERSENIRRIGHVAALFADAGAIVLAACISPFERDRNSMRELIGAGFLEVFVDAPLDVCEARDPKGLYRRARGGEIADFTGITSPYEPPVHADLHLRTGTTPADACAASVHALLAARGFLAPPSPEA